MISFYLIFLDYVLSKNLQLMKLVKGIPNHSALRNDYMQKVRLQRDSNFLKARFHRSHIASYEHAGEFKTGSFGLETPSEAELARRKRLKEEE